MPVIDQLKQIVHALGAPATLAERRFLAIGRSLELAVDVLARPIALAGEQADGKLTRNHAAIDAVTGEMLVALRRLGDADSSIAEALGTLGRDSVAAAGLLEAAATDFAVRREIGEVLWSSAAEATAIAGEVDNQAADAAEPTAHLLALLSRGYTMAREREIHGRHVTAPPDGTTPMTPQAAEADLADLLF